MIRILQRSEINTDLWDACVSSSPEGRIFGYSWYLDNCCPTWFGFVKGNYDAVFPLATKTKFGVDYCYQPFFTRYFGLYSKELSTPDERKIFLDLIPHHIRYIDCFIHEGHKELPQDAIRSTRCYQALDLSEDYTLLRSRYHENLLRNLRKAEKEGLRILPDYNPDTVVEHFRFHQHEKQLGFSEGDFHVLKKLMKAATINAKSRCWAVILPNEEILAGAFFMESHNRLVYLKGFSTPAGKKFGAMHFLFDRLIRAQAGLPSTLDFGGSNVESVARFYRSFGAADCVYLHLQANRLPPLLRWLKR